MEQGYGSLAMGGAIENNPQAWLMPLSMAVRRVEDEQSTMVNVVTPDGVEREKRKT